MASKRLLRLPAVKDKTGVASTNIYQMIKDGTFPKPVPVGARGVAWVEDEIDSWIDARIAAREAPRDGQRPRGGPGRGHKGHREPAPAVSAAA